MSGKKLDLEKKFVSRILLEEGQKMHAAQTKLMGQEGFSSRHLLQQRKFTESEQKLLYKHSKALRFVDMKTRNTKKGKVKKVSYPVHNRILYGHANNIVRRVSFGFTERVKQELMELDGASV